jgi:hypothetical protein
VELLTALETYETSRGRLSYSSSPEISRRGRAERKRKVPTPVAYATVDAMATANRERRLPMVPSQMALYSKYSALHLTRALALVKSSALI